MFRPFFVCVLPIPLALAAGDDAWKTKRAADGTDSDTGQILAESPCRRRNRQPQEETGASAAETPRPFNLRWESALPIREAELKARETNAPAVDEDHYAIAVYGIPEHLAKAKGKRI